MKIELDTNNLSPLDRQVLIAVVETLNSGAAPEQPVAAPVVKAKATPVKEKVAAPKVAAPVEAPTSEAAGDTGEEDLISAPATMSDAVAAATKLVTGGQSGKVKEALTDLGVKRVSELAPAQVAAFLTALEG